MQQLWHGPAGHTSGCCLFQPAAQANFDGSVLAACPPQTYLPRQHIIWCYMQVALRQFKLRTGSGGSGRWHGGEGVIREVGNDCLNIMTSA
jgi:N-methylhydantoinase B/oxoprolinase/acetone carboxylase alpha subunit